ncbi:hypothetical protein TNCV_117691 [Trichonephila clavipes]|nr:hypothetical protein TNCV_117691 [Trichonephila clavipes]
MRWARRILRMSPERTALENFNATTFNKRPKGRPKRRLKDCVDENFAILKVKNWRSIAGRRTEWKNTSEKIPQRAVMIFMLSSSSLHVCF